jgi:hypothetical protein
VRAHPGTIETGRAVDPAHMKKSGIIAALYREFQPGHPFLWFQAQILL